MLRRLVLAISLLFAAAPALADGRYSADRYDSRIESLDGDADMLVWRILPTEPRYAVAASTVDFSIPTAPAAKPVVDTHRVGDSQVQVSGRHIRIAATAIRSNGWLEASLPFARGSIID